MWGQFAAHTAVSFTGEGEGESSDLWYVPTSHCRVVVCRALESAWHITLYQNIKLMDPSHLTCVPSMPAPAKKFRLKCIAVSYPLLVNATRMDSIYKPSSQSQSGSTLSPLPLSHPSQLHVCADMRGIIHQK